MAAGRPAPRAPPPDGGAHETLSGIPVKELYGPAPGFDPGRDLGAPGEFPFTRSIHPDGYRGRFWTMRQYAGYEDSAETNRRFRYLLSQGQTGLSVAFDLPTQMGLDPGDPRAAAEVGRVGVSVASLKDMEGVFDGIPLDRVSASMTINATAPLLLALYVAVADGRGVPRSALSGTTQNDIFKEYVARGTYVFPPAASLRLTADLVKFAVRQVPKWNPISICGYHYREAGATAVQEAAFGIASGMAYTEACLDRGLGVDEFAPRFSFFHCVQNDFFEEIAKFRALRRMWARIMKERYGARNPRSMQFRFAVQTSGAALTAQQPEVNIIRTTLHTLAVVLGGAQSIQLACFDEAMALPTERAQRIALRTQQIVAHESGVTSTVDPVGGSYFVEALTDELEARAMDYIRRIESMGGGSMLKGFLRGVEEGFFQRETADASWRFQREVDSGKRVVVGLNKFQLDEKIAVPLHTTRPEVAKRRAREVEELKRSRDGAMAERGLEALRRAAEGDGDLMEPILEAVKARATVGEICGVLREVFGEYRPKAVF
ncbi:MAG: methylmalonyl-CoA mutase family protein [Halobacteria archaeon]